VNLFEPEIPTAPEPKLRLANYRLKMKELVGVYALYTDVRDKNQRMFKITNIDDTPNDPSEHTFWSYRYPEYKINMRGKDVNHPQNYVVLLTPHQRQKVLYHWNIMRTRNQQLKFIYEKMKFFPPEIVQIMYKLAEKYQNYTTEINNLVNIDKL
jgi:hypothetical protein